MLVLSPSANDRSVNARSTPMTCAQVDVSVCIANWNCKEYLRACLHSLQEGRQGVCVEIIVVDNASSDGAAEMVANDFPEVILIRNKTNLGFAAASNRAADCATGAIFSF